MILYFLLVLCNLSLVHLTQYPAVPCTNDLKPVNCQLTSCVDSNDPKSVVYKISEIPHFNDDNYYCDFDENRRNIICVSLLSTDYDEQVNNPKTGKGKMGSETDSGTWTERHEVAFTFNIRGKQYYFGQSILKGYKWFIHELLPGGRMGKETEYGFFDDYYPVIFPFSTNGRQFFYGYSTNTTVWFIRELLPGGRMGEETDRGSWDLKYDAAFPFTIDGRHYFRQKQNIIHGIFSFTQELLPNGRMGSEIEFGNNQKVAFHFFIYGKHFFYRHETECEKHWVIQELLKGGKMGNETDKGDWFSPHQVPVPFKINGQQFFYALKSNHRFWSIQQLLPNGKMGPTTDNGVWNDKYEFVVPFNIKGEQYLYGHSHKSKHWFIRSLN